MSEAIHTPNHTKPKKHRKVKLTGSKTVKISHRKGRTGKHSGGHDDKKHHDDKKYSGGNDGKGDKKHHHKDSSCSDSDKSDKCRHDKCRSGCLKNIDIAEEFIDLFVAGQGADILDLLNNQVTLTLQDQAGNIPFGGTFQGLAGVTQFLTVLASFTFSQSYVRGETFANCDYSRIIVEITGSNILRCNPGSEITAEFFQPLFVDFVFDRCGKIGSINIVYDTSAQDQFFSTCGGGQ